MVAAGAVTAGDVTASDVVEGAVVAAGDVAVGAVVAAGDVVGGVVHYSNACKDHMVDLDLFFLHRLGSTSRCLEPNQLIHILLPSII